MTRTTTRLFDSQNGLSIATVLLGIIFVAQSDASLISEFELGNLGKSSHFSINADAATTPSEVYVSPITGVSINNLSIDYLSYNKYGSIKCYWDSIGSWTFELTPKTGFQVSLDAIVIEGGAYKYSPKDSYFEAFGNEDKQTLHTALAGLGDSYSIDLSLFHNRTDTIAFSAHKEEISSSMPFSFASKVDYSSSPDQAFNVVKLYGVVSPIPEPATRLGGIGLLVILALHGWISRK